MSRPIKKRVVNSTPKVFKFSPRGMPGRPETVILTVEEFEALRLYDSKSLPQTDAAERMSVSRQTFGRVLKSARKKIADALVRGKAVKIWGGNYTYSENENFLDI